MGREQGLTGGSPRKAGPFWCALSQFPGRLMLMHTSLQVQLSAAEVEQLDGIGAAEGAGRRYCWDSSDIA